jgi:hypothetical protein
MIFYLRLARLADSEGSQLRLFERFSSALEAKLFLQGGLL